MSVGVRADLSKLKNIIKGVSKKIYTYTISDGVEYGIYVELGTSRMAARPALGPAFEKVKGQLLKAIPRAVEGGVPLDDIFGKAAFDVQAAWAGDVPVDTGAYKNSIHVLVGESFKRHYERLKRLGG